MNKKLTNKVAIITGSTSERGAGFARGMADAGAAVVVSGRSMETGDRISAEINQSGGRAIFVQADISKEADCANLIKTTLQQFERVDILVNNAAHLGRIPFEGMTSEQWDQVYAVNVRGAFLCSRCAIPAMKEQGGGEIINIGTTMTFQSSKLEHLAYINSKGALLTMTKTMARAYANGWYQGPRDPAFFAEAATKVVEKGYTALKFDPFGSAYRFMDRGETRRSLQIVAAVREAVGEDVDLLIEAHDRLSVSTAVQIGRALEEFEPMWFETPVMSTDIQATIEIAKAINIPVASGERFKRLSECLDLVSSRVVSILQTETLNIGGIGPARKSAAIAESAEAFIALHQAQSPFNTAVNAHIHASIPNFLIQECFDDFLAPWSKEIMMGVPQVVDGYLKPSDEPGIGVQLNIKEMAKHPYGQNNFLRLFEDGWERRSS